MIEGKQKEKEVKECSFSKCVCNSLCFASVAFLFPLSVHVYCVYMYTFVFLQNLCKYKAEM